MTDPNNRLLHFLVVDDDPHMLFFLKHTFQTIKLPVQIDWFKNGEEFIRYLEESGKNTDGIDCTVMDLNMPRKNGWETLTEMQVKKITPSFPIIMISHSRQSNVQDLKQLGATDFLEKPSALKEYEGFVQKLVSYTLPGSASS